MKTFLSTSIFLRCILLLIGLKDFLAHASGKSKSLPPKPPPPPPVNPVLGLKEVIINMGDHCTIEAYEAAYIGESDPNDILKNLIDATYIKGTEVRSVLANLDQICAPVSKDKIIDHLQFRCANIARHSETPDYRCICDSEKMSSVDFRAPQPISIPGSLRLYNEVQGLDQRLLFDLTTLKCYSGERGHCTLDRYVSKREHDGVGIMKCLSKLKCEEGNGSFKFGTEIYGVCHKEESNQAKFERSANGVDSLSSCHVRDILALGVIANLCF